MARPETTKLGKKDYINQKLGILDKNQQALYNMQLDLIQSILPMLPTKTMAEYEFLKNDGLPVYMLKVRNVNIGGVAGVGMFIITEPLENTKQPHKDTDKDSK